MRITVCIMNRACFSKHYVQNNNNNNNNNRKNCLKIRFTIQGWVSLCLAHFVQNHLAVKTYLLKQAVQVFSFLFRIPFGHLTRLRHGQSSTLSIANVTAGSNTSCRWLHSVHELQVQRGCSKIVLTPRLLTFMNLASYIWDGRKIALQMPDFIFIQQISVLNTLNMLYNLHFFSSKCLLFHNATLFGFCITHILNTGCAKI